MVLSPSLSDIYMCVCVYVIFKDCHKTFAVCVTGKRWITRIYEYVLQVNKESDNDPLGKWAKEMNRQFSTEGIRMTKNTLNDA